MLESLAPGQCPSAGTLDPGDAWQETYTGHVWVVRGADSGPTACFVAASEPGLAGLE